MRTDADRGRQAPRSDIRGSVTTATRRVDAVPGLLPRVQRRIQPQSNNFPEKFLSAKNLIFSKKRVAVNQIFMELFLRGSLHYGGHYMVELTRQLLRC